MKVIWSKFAKECLREIFQFYKKEAGINVACNIRSKVFNATRNLADYPKSGQIETNLKSLKEEYRYCLSGNYKIIYKEVKEGILIVDVFDTRQNPSKMIKRKNK